MLNLLPSQQKIAIQKEYSARRYIVAFGFVISVLAISLALLSPSYFSTRTRAKIAGDELKFVKQAIDAELPSAELVSELSAAVKHAEALKPLAKPVSVYELVRIFEGKPKTIKISDISFSDQTGDRPVFTLRGMAQDRESLTAFGRTLESRVEFESVDLPISNFVKERDIDFSMTIALKQ